MRARLNLRGNEGKEKTYFRAFEGERKKLMNGQSDGHLFFQHVCMCVIARLWTKSPSAVVFSGDDGKPTRLLFLYFSVQNLVCYFRCVCVVKEKRERENRENPLPLQFLQCETTIISDALLYSSSSNQYSMVF